MQKKIENYLIVSLLIIVTFVTSVIYFFPQIHNYAFFNNGKDEGVHSVMELIHGDASLLMSDENLGESAHQLRLELPANMTLDNIEITQDYLYHTITISIPGLDENYLYNYPLVGSSDHIEDFTFDVAEKTGMLQFTTDHVYELQTTAEKQYVYLDFVDPHEIYDAIVVIDAGHGGKDGGCSGGGIKEKDLNLSITEKMKSYFATDGYNIGVYYTRERDFNPTYESRVGLANDLNADLFLSVHINSTASGRTSSINGSEVMYRSGDETGLSKAFAGHCLDSMLSSLGSNSKGLVAGDNIFIIRTSKVPVALAEIGFITNKDERVKLADDAYQETTAGALHQAIITTLQENGAL